MKKALKNKKTMTSVIETRFRIAGLFFAILLLSFHRALRQSAYDLVLEGQVDDHDRQRA